MSVSPAPNLEGYATVDDVADSFEKFDDGFDDTTNPSASQVERRIRVESDWVDNYTGIAFRPRRVENEYLTLQGSYYFSSGTPLSLRKRNILSPLDRDKGDRLQVFQGTESSGQYTTDDGYESFLLNPELEQGRNQDFWIERSTGMLYLYRRKTFFQRHKEIRISYRYGQEWPDPADNPDDSSLTDEQYKRQNVPQAVREATALRVAAHYYESQAYRTTVPGNEEAPDATTVAESYREQAEALLENYKEIRTVGNQ